MVAPPSLRREGDRVARRLTPGKARPSDAVPEASDAEFRPTGLERASVIPCAKLFAMEQRSVLRVLGRLGRATTSRLDAAVAAAAVEMERGYLPMMG